ncbi:MAG TPA: 4Fe-4S dicluster domain-containing protein, partial [Aurantimonas sp.]|nr:4Fe-4S dicluster domain-containing protein [Aurantimonas sp.]
MQTTFTPAQLADPEVAHSEGIIRKCVHCGFCTATCPTYVTLGNELDSPRGRIYLIKEMLENDRPADEKTVKHIDRCLSCLACMTTCPSGVNYMHLVDHARVHIERTYRRPLVDRMIRRVLAMTLPYPARFRASLTLARLARPLAPLLAGIQPLKPLAAMLRLAPGAVPARSAVNEPGVRAATGPRRGRVAILRGCAQSVLDPKIN